MHWILSIVEGPPVHPIPCLWRRTALTLLLRGNLAGLTIENSVLNFLKKVPINKNADSGSKNEQTGNESPEIPSTC